MKLIFVFFYILLFCSNSFSQVWVGNFEGTLNNDPIKITLENSTTNGIKGVMKDSYQTYLITAETNGNRIAGDAKESTLGLHFTVLGEMKNNSIHFNFILENTGQKQETKFIVTRVNATNNIIPTTPPLMERDPAVVGKWSKNETYNSGSGDNFMGANFSQTIIFLQDGGLIEGGSAASMSGSDFYGSSADYKKDLIAGVYWYTSEKQLWLVIDSDGKTEKQMLGRYYIEGKNMLITGSNGSKLLLSR